MVQGGVCAVAALPPPRGALFVMRRRRRPVVEAWVVGVSPTKWCVAVCVYVRVRTFLGIVALRLVSSRACITCEAPQRGKRP